LWGNSGPGDPYEESNEVQAYELRTFVGRLLVDAPPVTRTAPQQLNVPQPAKGVTPTTQACMPCLQGESGTTHSAKKAGDPPKEIIPVCSDLNAKNPNAERDAAGNDIKDFIGQQGSSENSDVLVAIGDRGGARDASIWAVFDREGEISPSVARRIAIDLTLRGNNLALTDASHSRLWFDSADLRLLYEHGKPFAELKAGELPRARA
jgi:hypothetical protein